MRPRDWRSFLTGAALGILAVKLLPIVKQAARPVARGLIAGAVDLTYKTRTMMAQAREELDNMVAEAQFEQGRGSATEVAPTSGALPEPAATAPTIPE